MIRGLKLIKTKYPLCLVWVPKICKICANPTIYAFSLAEGWYLILAGLELELQPSPTRAWKYHIFWAELRRYLCSNLAWANENCKTCLPEHIDPLWIMIKIPNPSQKPSAFSKAPNQAINDMDFLCTFKIKIESQNFEHGFIKDQ